MEENIFRVGSTYEYDETDVNITEEARTRIVENLDSLIDVPYEIVDQVAGIRPTTGDRRPVIGEHKEHKELYIFNGLGAKGYLLAPLLSQELMNHILNDDPLHPELALQRFKEKQLPR
jgi:glycine oxidase